MDFKDNYLENIKKHFLYYKSLGEKAMDQLETKQLFHSQNEHSNSIAIIVKHMHGNMLSRWTDFLTTDGEKEWRKRDEEFEQEPLENIEVSGLWKEGWDCFLAAINSLNTTQLTKTIFIRGEALTVMDAINRQLAHYAYHIGQIVFAAKQLQGEKWNSLSIPKRKK
jgi:hypothetical protein